MAWERVCRWFHMTGGTGGMGRVIARELTLLPAKSSAA